MKIFKNLFGNSSKIDIDEIAAKVSGARVLLGFCVIKEHKLSSDGSYVRFGNGLTLAWKTNLRIEREQSDRMVGTWVLPFDPGSNRASYMVLPVLTNNHMDVKYRGVFAGNITDSNNVNVRMWTLENQSLDVGNFINCNVFIIGF